jgi:ribulose-phosphate 3-epimerase
MSRPLGTRVKIAPSILNADFGHLAESVRLAEAGGADWIHVDVMDGAFVPNITLGPMVVEAIRRATRLPLDIHLMVEEPRRYLRAFREAGGDWLTVHVEADRHPHRTLGEIHELGARAGLALNPGTPLAAAEELLESIDLLLVMSVNPGFGGQTFIPTVLDKIRRARQLLVQRNPACELEVDGGIKVHNAPEVARAGSSVLVAGSFVYEGGEGVEANIASLRKSLDALTTA